MRSSLKQLLFNIRSDNDESSRVSEWPGHDLQTVPGAPAITCRHTRPSSTVMSALRKHSALQTTFWSRSLCPSLFEELQRISFKYFKRNLTHMSQMSHMAERKCFVVDYFYFRLKKSLHIYVSKYLYIVVNVSTTACSTRAIELNTLHEMILFTKSSLIFMLHSSLNHNFKLLTKDFVKFTFQVHKLTKLDKNQCLIRIAWGRESLILMSPIKWIYWLLNNGLCFKSEKWQFNNFPLHRITRYFSHKTYVYTCNNMCLCTFLHKG